MLMLAPASAGGLGVTVVFSDGGSFGSTLATRLAARGSPTSSCEVRSSPVLESWEGLKDVCDGANTVYLLSALDLPTSPNDADLKHFTKGVDRVVDCCLQCGVEGLVFTSTTTCSLPPAVANEQRSRRGRGETDGGIELGDPADSLRGDPKAYAVAMAEASVLEASGALSASGPLHTCALRPPPFIYGSSVSPERERPLHRALSWAGWGLNRVAVGSAEVEAVVEWDAVHEDNLVEAHLLAGGRLRAPLAITSPAAEGEHAESVDGNVDGDADADPAAKARRLGCSGSGGEAVPACSGRAYSVTDGQTRNPQAFLNDVFDGLGFATSKSFRVPTRLALLAAWLAELACKAGVTSTPALTRPEVRALAESRPSLSNTRARRDLGYVPPLDPRTAMEKTVEALRRAGWAKHRVLRPALGYWICNPVGIWLLTLAAFGGPCPSLLAPLATNAENVGLLLLHQLQNVRAVCVAVYLVHVLEGVYAFRVARRAGHRDAAPAWFLQTFLLGFPSINLVNRLRNEREEGGVMGNRKGRVG
ncbi:unnamed protein product [Scytosiphon promiscuus]